MAFQDRFQEIDKELTEVLYKAQEVEFNSSTEPPNEKWFSQQLKIPEENIKKLIAEPGLHHPESGEICTKYIGMSDSDVFAHLFFYYPSVRDPGIEKALFGAPDVLIYPDDGQKLYAAVCDEMNLCPVKIFQRGLLEEIIDLKYYGVNPVGVRAMGMALQHNRNVKILDLTDNFLTNDACYHLGQMLSTNFCLSELNLSGCRIGSSGALSLFTGLSVNRALEVLNLNRNQLGDTGIEHLASAVFSGVTVKNLYLSKNDISGKGVLALEKAFEINNEIVVLDLSWNNLYTGLLSFLSILSQNKNLQQLSLSWNRLGGTENGLAIKQILKAPKLTHLDLSNNILADIAISKMITTLGKARCLKTLDLSFNPITQKDALNILKKMTSPAVKLQRLVMENVTVDGQFVDLLQIMKCLEAKKDAIVIYGSVEQIFKSKGPDPRDLVLSRVDYLTRKNKKATSNMALIALQLAKDKMTNIDGKDLNGILMKSNVSLGSDLIDAIILAFPGPRSRKGRFLNVNLLVDFIKRKWPDVRLPPTPPPEPEPEHQRGKVTKDKTLRKHKRKGKK